MSDPWGPILARYPARARPRSVPEPLGNAGGASGARLWRFESGLGRLVVRCWPREGPGPEALGRIHRWLGEVADLGFVPVPIAGLDGHTFQVDPAGRLWELTPWLPGAPDPSCPPSREHLRAGLTGLAALHQALAGHATTGPSPGLRRRLVELDELLAGGFDAREEAVARRGPDPLRPMALEWLARARRAAPAVRARVDAACGRTVRLQPCPRDVRPEHLLFDGPSLTGIVDFGAMGVDTVAGDLARLLGDWLGPDRPARAEALDAYAAVRPLDPAEAALLDVFEASTALLGAGHWVRWHFVEGRSFDDPEAVARGLRRAMRRFTAGRRGEGG